MKQLKERLSIVIICRMIFERDDADGRNRCKRTPIREALNMLSQEGLVRIIPKKGIMVLPLTMKEVAMTFEARMLMEPYIIEHYSQYIDPVKLLELRNQTEEILQTDIADNEHAERCCDLDDELHRTIADACKNKYLSMNLSSIYDQNMRIRILGERNIWERHKIAPTNILNSLIISNPVISPVQLPPCVFTSFIQKKQLSNH